jgi:hypothetical protein
VCGAESSTLADARVSAVCGAESSTLADARVSAVCGAESSTLADARVSAVCGAESSTLADARICGRVWRLFFNQMTNDKCQMSNVKCPGFYRRAYERFAQVVLCSVLNTA